MHSDAPELVAYDDGGCLVICDPETPNAWLRSDTTLSVTDTEERTRSSP